MNEKFDVKEIYLSVYIETKKQNIERCLIEDLIRLLKDNKGLEEIWISNGKKYPCIVIHLNNNLAAVSYFSKDENEADWTSVGNHNSEVVFLAGGEEWNAPANSIISIDKAIECVKEFAMNENEKPTAIKWQQLV